MTNAIGKFQIGNGAVGHLLPIVTNISQYQSSPTILQLLQCFDAWYNPSGNIDFFYANIVDVDSAVGYGLDVWGRRVGVSRVVNLTSTEFLGLTGLSGASGTAFGGAPWYDGSGIGNNNYVLVDAQFRTMIYAKMLSNICDGSIPAINQILLTLFPGRGDCYCTDGGNMTMTYTFHFTLTAIETAILNQSGILPTPCGVASSIVVI